MFSRLGVIADTHGHADAWEKALNIWGNIDAILHAGDVLKSNLNTGLAQCINASSVPVLIAKGNSDFPRDQEELRWPILSPYVTVWWQGRMILVSHGNNFSQVRKLALLANADLVVTGHTHIGSLVREGHTFFLNPGSAALPRGRDPASVAIIEENEIRIVTLEGQLLHREEW
ncbi:MULTISPECIES: YfcE family phosphodiesterase [Aminobacterium]|uniref:YfcE family phosphodiesterase n=1 Tax=Aminobacterium TaxID=81466 RepID=UPI00257C372B|nr:MULTISPECIES: YfcE family phosphodiesterase [unclassified Aminobacterium]